MRKGFKAEAERVAVNYRQQLGLRPHDPLPARELANHLKVRILTPNDIAGMTDDILDLLLVRKSDTWSAAIFEKFGKKFIIHNPTHTPARQESDLMHELAHAHCEHRLENLETALMGLMLPLRKYNDVQEKEAEYMGGCLQLPREALLHHYAYGNKSAVFIAQMFNASINMTQYRLGVSGAVVIKQRRQGKRS